jgi:hypothetical protein
MAKKHSNVAPGLRWSAETAGLEFGFHQATVRSRLLAEGIIPGEDGLFSTQQITATMYGNLHRQRLRRTTADALGKELANRALQGQYTKTLEIERSLEKCFMVIRQELLASSMTEHEKHSVLSHLAEYQPPQ